MGLVASLVSVRAALVTSSLLLTPALFLARRANARVAQQGEGEADRTLTKL